jgi:PmbA protein
MSTREVIQAKTSSIKLGVVDSQIASIRTQSEAQTAVRIYEGGCVGVASAIGSVDLDRLTGSAREALAFEIPYPVAPEANRSLSAEHLGDRHGVASLVALAQPILAQLVDAYPAFVFSHGVEHNRTSWSLTSDAGLDLHYQRATTQVVFVVKEKGSGNIIDTFLVAEGLSLDPEAVLATFAEHLEAYGRVLPPRTGRQRVVFPGLQGLSSASLLQLVRSDLSARAYGTGASFFDGRVGDGKRYLHPDLHLVEARDPALHRVCPFDMEGVVRDPLDLDVIRDGQLHALAANKRDALRFEVPATGTGAGDVGSLPVSAFGRLALRPTADKLADLLDDDGGLLVWFVAGGDTTRAGDMAMPAQILIALDGEGRPVGRVPGGTLRANFYDALGDDFVGVTAEPVDPFSDDGFVVTHMAL